MHYQTTASDIPSGGNPYRAVIAKDYTPTAWTGRETRNSLRALAASGRPFFLFSSYFKPHSPHTIPEPYDALYNDAEIPLPRQVDLDYIQRLPLPVQKLILRETPRYAMDRQRLLWMYRSYYGDVTWLDEEVGATLAELERSGQTDNTIIIVTTDHGGSNSRARPVRQERVFRRLGSDSTVGQLARTDSAGGVLGTRRGSRCPAERAGAMRIACSRACSGP